jgi:hypothetical protein
LQESLQKLLLELIKLLLLAQNLQSSLIALEHQHLHPLLQLQRQLHHLLHLLLRQLHHLLHQDLALSSQCQHSVRA